MRFVNTIGLPATKELFYTARKVSARGAGPETGRPRLPPGGTPPGRPGDGPGDRRERPPLDPRDEADPRPVHAVPRPSPREAEEAEELIRACMNSRDLLEGKQAFLEKRKTEVPGEITGKIRAPTPVRSALPGVPHQREARSGAPAWGTHPPASLPRRGGSVSWLAVR